MSPNDTDTGQSHGRSPAGGGGVWLSRAIRLVLVLGVLGAGAGISVYWMRNRPTPERRPPGSEAVLVEVHRVTRGPHPVTVRAMGTVGAAREVQLAARVGGEIIEVSGEFVPGGRFEAGQRMLQIEPRDYDLVVQQRSSDLARTDGELKVELGQQSVARREYALLGETVDKEDEELVLRRPQLATAQAAVAAARASLEQARLDLDRTTVRAPFNAMVQSREVDVGSQVSAGAPLATLVWTDAFWVEVTVPVNQLRWLTIPRAAGEAGSPARIYHEAAWGADVKRDGTIARLKADLEPLGRMARLLVSVADPLSVSTEASQRPAMILGAYVRVELEGRPLENVVRVPRTALRDGNRVWVMAADNTLNIHHVAVAWSGNDHVYVSDGLADGDALVTSDLAVAVEGMLLRTGSAPASETEGGQAEREGRPGAGEARQ